MPMFMLSIQETRPRACRAFVECRPCHAMPKQDLPLLTVRYAKTIVEVVTYHMLTRVLELEIEMPVWGVLRYFITLFVFAQLCI